MKKFLVCFDGSEWSKKGLNEAITLAEKIGGEITVLSVVPVLCFLESGVDCNTVTDLFRVEAEGNLRQAEDILNERGVRGEKLILEGNPADVIVDFAENNNFDFIVIGSKGKNATERTLFGSVTQKVAAHATKSVLIIR